MAHEITEKDEIFSVREKPWHGLGKVLTGAPNGGEAMRLAGLDWQDSKGPGLSETTISTCISCYRMRILGLSLLR